MSFSVGLYTGSNQDPVRLVLEGDAVDSIADSLKRIADTMTECKQPTGGEVAK
jgi:hypothetical protein